MSKNLFYDWLGYNHTIFHHTHHFLDNPTIIKSLEFLTDYVGNYKMFPFHFILLGLTIALLIKRPDCTKGQAITYIKAILLLCISMTVILSIGQAIKVTLAFSRPYCTSNTILNEIVAMITRHDPDSCYKSMPSGHSLYITTFVLSMWNIVNKPLKIIGAALLILIPISRVVLGFHFPADVFYGVTIAAAVTLLIKRYSNPLLTKFSEKIYKKIDS